MYFGRNGQEYKKGNTLLFMIRVQKLIFYLQVLISKVKVKLNNPPPPKKKDFNWPVWAAVPGVARSRT